MKADQVIDLVRAHVERNDDRFRAVALAIAANEEPKSTRVAQSIRRLVDRAPQMIQLPHQFAELFSQGSRPIKLQDLVLDDETRRRIDRVIVEQRARDRLFVHGMHPSRKLLFVGPPGVGKTAMASALASELQLAHLNVQLHGVLSSHLGETSGKLAKVFTAIRSTRAVYLFDEFDALAPARGGNDRHEVGEMRRVVNSLLQFIETDDSDSIIIGATNHVDIIDGAMFRRFDQVIEFPLPTAGIARTLIESRLLWADGIDWSGICEASAGLGHADLEAACVSVNKDAILNNKTTIATDDLVAAIRSRARHEGTPRYMAPEQARSS